MNLAFFSGLIVAANLISMGFAEEQKPVSKTPAKKEQRVTVMVNQDGKSVKIDTVFNFADEKAIQVKVDSILKKHGIECKVSENGKMIILNGDEKHMILHDFAGGDPRSRHMKVMMQSCDSGKSGRILKKITIGDKGMVTGIDLDGDLIPPPPPPPVPPFHVKGFRMMQADPFAFDPEDGDILTYDKKDIGKGLEKITIVRKKHQTGNEEKKIGVEVEVTDEQKK